MTRDQWQQINDLYHASLERDPSERKVFIAQACGDDDQLRREVESLIASHEQSDGFIEQPVFDAVARLLTADKPGLLAGRHISHYEILAELGTGGMGEVYLAQDTKLGRQVAIKLLPYRFTTEGDRVRRFQQEARSASALNQPNIITIHEVGEVENRHYIATEFIDGQTLREIIRAGPMPVGEALEIASQITNALAAAHESGIIHRDIKPENIMVRRRDHLVKVLDFGLAKLTDEPADQRSADAGASTLLETDPNTVMGTVSYMSPEQARRHPVDPRTDVFSLGVVIYEMVAGCRPFAGSTYGDLLVSILDRNPAPFVSHRPDVPTELEKIVIKALEKDADNRYQTIQEMRADLRRLRQQLRNQAGALENFEWGEERVPVGERVLVDSGRAASTRNNKTSTLTTFSGSYIVSRIKRHKTRVMMALAAALMLITAAVYFSRSSENQPINSLAIMPFSFSSSDENVSADPDREYLSDGITESLINNLSQLPEVKVIARSSVFRYKGQQTDPRAMGKELGVRALLTGRIVQRGDTLTISVELIDTKDHRHIWGEQYERKMADLQAVQRDIVKQISENLSLKLTGGERQQLNKQHTENTEAYQLYLKGRYLWNKRTNKPLKKALDYFQQAIEKDQNYALAYTGIADCYNLLPEINDSVAMQRAAATRALELDDTLAEARASLAHIYLFRDGNWPKAEAEFRQAIQLNPNYATAHQWYALQLAAMGRHDEALAEIRRAHDIDPLSLIINHNMGLIFYLGRRYGEALEQFRKTLDLDPNYYDTYFGLGITFGQKGMYKEALANLRKAVSLTATDTDSGAALAYFYAASGQRAEAQKILDEFDQIARQGPVPAYYFSLIHTGLGDKDKAIAELETAAQKHWYAIVYLRQEPMFDPLRSDPRFAELLKSLNLNP